MSFLNYITSRILNTIGRIWYTTSYTSYSLCSLSVAFMNMRQEGTVTRALELNSRNRTSNYDSLCGWNPLLSSLRLGFLACRLGRIIDGHLNRVNERISKMGLRALCQLTIGIKYRKELSLFTLRLTLQRSKRNRNHDKMRMNRKSFVSRERTL